jgi:hypothetical protein
MAIEFFTGFEGCTTTAQLLRFFNSVSSDRPKINLTGGWDNSVCLDFDRATYSDTIIKNCIESNQKACGFHISHTSIHARILFSFLGPSIHFYNTSEGISCYRGTTFLGMASEHLTTGKHHLEIELYSHETEGYVIVKKDANIILNLLNINTGGQNITSLRWGNAGVPRLDNIYIADTLQGELYSVLLKPSEDSSVD